eukprot:4447836-Amphidinium_carterae.1
MCIADPTALAAAAAVRQELVGGTSAGRAQRYLTEHHTITSNDRSGKQRTPTTCNPPPTR